MAEQLGHDVDGQTTGDGFGGKDSSEVVWCEADWIIGDGGDPGLRDRLGDHAGEVAGGDDSALATVGTLNRYGNGGERTRSYGS